MEITGTVVDATGGVLVEAVVMGRQEDGSYRVVAHSPLGHATLDATAGDDQAPLELRLSAEHLPSGDGAVPATLSGAAR